MFPVSRSARRCPSRRGLALVVVMAAIAACLVIAVAFLHAQSGSLRTTENLRSGDRAREAAGCGLAAALSDLQSPAWAGVGTVLTGQMGADASGAWSYRVTFAPVAADGTAATAMKLGITSVGTFQAAGNSRPVTRTMEGTVQLVPRLPATGTPSDRQPVPAFDAQQAFALFVADTADLPPQAKVVGDAWVKKDPEVYKEVNWSTAVRVRAGASSPEPVTGKLYVYDALDANRAANLTALLGAGDWVDTNASLALAGLSFSQFATTQDYRIYQGGPTYRSVAVSGTLDGTSGSPVVLGPTAANPLGIFYHSGDVHLKDNVRIAGTLVVTGKVVFEGPGIEITAVAPSASGGSAALPALIVGGDVEIKKEAAAAIGGMVYCEGDAKREEVDHYAGRSVVIAGSLATKKLDLHTPPMWKALGSGDWDTQSGNCPAGTPFLPWLANNANWPLLFWGLTYSLHGLSNEPTFLVSRPADARYVLGVPLFRPDPSTWNAGGGYRWAVVSWGESP